MKKKTQILVLNTNNTKQNFRSAPKKNNNFTLMKYLYTYSILYKQNQQKNDI